MTRRLVAVAACLALLASLLLGFFPQGFLRDAAERRLSAALGGRVTVERLHVVPWRLRVELTGIAIESAGLTARVAAVRVEALPETLRGRALALRSLEIRGVEAELRPAGPATPTPAAPLPPIRIGSMALIDGRVRYADPAMGGDIVASGIEAAGALGSGALDVRVAELRSLGDPAPPPVSVRARAEITPDLRLTLAQAALSTPRSKLTATGPVGPLRAPAPDLRLEAQIDAAELAGVVASLQPAQGTLRASGLLQGSNARWQADFAAPTLTASGLPIADLRGEASGQGATAVAKLVFGCFEGRVSVEARLANRGLDARVEATGVESAALARRSGSDVDLRGPLSASLGLRGPLTRLDAALSAEGPELTLDGSPLALHAEARGAVVPDTGSVELAWTARAEALPHVELAGASIVGARIEARGTASGAGMPAITAQASGRLDAAGTPDRTLPFEVAYRGRGPRIETLTVRVPEAPLAGLFPETSGFLGGEVELRGTLERPTGVARVSGRDVAWREVAVGALALAAEGRDGSWTLHGELPAHALRVEAASPLPARGARRVSGRLALTDTALASLGSLLPEALLRDGRVSGTVSFEGPLASPDALELTSDLALSGSGYDARLEGRAGAAEKAPLGLRLRAKADAEILRPSPTVDVAGTLTADLSLGGTRSTPSARGELRLSDGRVSGKGLPEIAIASALVSLDGSEAVLQPTLLALADGQLTASGRYPLSGRAPARVHLEWSGLAAEQLIAALAPDGAPATSLRARLSGSADAEGRGAELAGWTATASFGADGMRAADLEIALTPVSLRLEHGVVEAAPFTLRSGPGSLDLQGRVDLVRRGLDLAGKGSLDLRALSPLLRDVSLTGEGQVDLAVSGPFEAPSPRGSISVRRASFRSRAIPEALTNAEARVVLTPERLDLPEARATLGGGTLTASGSGAIRGRSLADLSIRIQGRDMALRYPVGLRSRIEADLLLTQANAGLLLSGDVRALRGVYDLDMAIQESVKAPVVEPEPSAFLRSIGLDVRVQLESPVLVRNKLANVDVGGRLQFRGDLETPAPFGRLEVAGGGKVFLTGRDFAVETGRLTYNGDWNAEVELRATRRVRDENDQREYDVALVADGPFETVQPVLRAEGLSDSQTLSLVATGRTGGTSGKDFGAQVAGQQAANLLLGQVSQGLGFDEVSVQPELLVRETDPGARFTFGKQLTPMLSIIYSMSLQGAEQRFIQVEARLQRGISVKGQRTDDGLLAAAVGQRLAFVGRRPDTSREKRVRLEAVELRGDAPEDARKALKAKRRRRVQAWDIQEDVDRLRRHLVDAGYIEAQVGGRLEGRVAIFDVDTGPRFVWRVDGMDSPPDLARTVRQALYEEDAIERSRTRLLAELRERGFLRARVTGAGEDAGPGQRLLVFAVEPGARLSATVEFPGATRVSPGALLEAAGGPGALLSEPAQGMTRIRQAYAAAGFFDVRAGPPTLDESAGQILIRVPIQEGASPRIASVTFLGASLAEADLRQRAGLVGGAAYTAASVAAAVERVRNHYYSLGYAHVGVVAENTLKGADVEVRFRVREGARQTVGSVTISGLRRTREPVVQRLIRFKPGDPLDPRRLARTERDILDLGIFAQVAVTAGSEEEAAVKIDLVEKERIEVAYDLRWSEETGTSVQLDGEMRNLLGLGLNLGGRYRFGGDDREKRASLAAPTFRRGKFTVAAYETQEDLPEVTDPLTGDIITNTKIERVIEFQQWLPLSRRLNVMAGYRYKTVTTTSFQIPIHVASVDASAARDARDSPLDARTGDFESLNFEVSPEALGSDLTFIKGFAQFFLHRRLSPAWTWSQAYRVGLAHGFGGQKVISSERFKAGGPDSLRGFAQDSLGPQDASGEAVGGEAVLVFNQELRFRPRSWGFALFWDFGNVFESVADMSLDLRHDLGGGLRWASPIGVLRLDLAFPLARKEGEGAYELSFSLGQAF